MTGPATRSAMFALLGTAPLHSDPVQSRVAAAHPRTHSEELQAVAAGNPTAPQQLSPPVRILRSGSRSLHPGDILYWTACLGGVGLLLLFALR
jgi:hypothetical protein